MFQVRRVNLVLLVLQVNLVLVDLVVPLAIQELQEPQDPREQLVLLAPQGLKERSVLLGLLVLLGHLVPQVHQVIQVSLDQWEPQGLLDNLVNKDPRAQRARRVPLDRQVQLERKELRVQMVQRVLQEQQVVQETLGHQGHQVHLELQGARDLQVLKEKISTDSSLLLEILS